jgi:hypothetical protein
LPVPGVIALSGLVPELCRAQSDRVALRLDAEDTRVARAPLQRAGVTCASQRRAIATIPERGVDFTSRADRTARHHLHAGWMLCVSAPRAWFCW